jgi:alpha-tubulin suppressor-like RCC1 family protein
MAYKISGVKSETARVMVLKESDWSVESNAVISGSGAYEVVDLDASQKLMLGMSDEGEIIAFGDVAPVMLPNEIWTVGRNQYGQLGQGDIVELSVLAQVGSMDYTADIAAGGNVSAALDADGKLWSWGDTRNGVGRVSAPVQVGVLTDWSDVNDGQWHSGAVKTDGTLWMWGSNNYGQLGQNNVSTSILSPVQVGAAIDWDHSTCSAYATHAINTDGKLYSWGKNASFGQLGLGDNVDYSLPVQVGAETDWNSIDVGMASDFAVAIRNGGLWAWGNNADGQLAQGNTTRRSSPVQVGVATNWNQATCGGSFMVAINDDGELWVCGYNEEGQLGQNNTTNLSVLTQVGGLSDWDSVACGTLHVFAIKTDGTLWAWGINTYSQLGLGDQNHRSLPVQVGVATNWTLVNCGYGHTTAIKG